MFEQLMRMIGYVPMNESYREINEISQKLRKTEEALEEKTRYGRKYYGYYNDSMRVRNELCDMLAQVLEGKVREYKGVPIAKARKRDTRGRFV